jgi:hypothetical protein
MKRFAPALFLTLLLALAAGCATDNGNGATPAPPPTETPPATVTPEVTPDPTPTPTGTPTDEVASCLQAAAYVDDGPIAVNGTAEGNADRVLDLRWAAHEGCERFVIDLVDEDGNAASGAGRVEAALLRDLGLVRVELLDVEWVEPDASDAEFEGPLATRAFSVWSPDGRWTFVDLHLGEAAEAAVTLLDDRVVVDLVPGGTALPAPAVHEGLVVVLEPRGGTSTYPLTVFGYSRTFEANVVVRLEQDGDAVFEEPTTATSWVDAWGYYSLTIDDGPSGAVTLHVGEHSARDGEWQGVAIDLEME